MHVFLSDFLLDIVQNSLEAGATRVDVSIKEDDRFFSFRIEDNGKGMSAEELARAKDPFYTDGKKHAKRKVGLGIPFVMQSSEQAGGEFTIRSEAGVGTVVSFSFAADNIDTPPLGNISATLVAIFSAPTHSDIVVTRTVETSVGNGGYQISRNELIDALGEIQSSGSLNLMREFLVSQEEELEAFRTSASPSRLRANS